jgi:hypothetical protein
MAVRGSRAPSPPLPLLLLSVLLTATLLLTPLAAPARAADAAGACDASQQQQQQQQGPQQQGQQEQQQQGQQRPRPVLVVGSVNVDITMQVHRLPRQGETTTAASPRSTLAVGGKGANQAVAAARLRAPGAPPAAFAAQLGSDAHGDMLSSELAGAGVDVTGCGRVEGYPSGACVSGFCTIFCTTPPHTSPPPHTHTQALDT